MDTRSMLGAFNPNLSTSTNDLLKRLIAEREGLESDFPSSPAEYMNRKHSTSGSFGASRPGYLTDVMEHAAKAAPVDYSRYEPRQRYSLSDRLALAQQMPKESRHLALAATAPMYPKMKSGWEAFAEAALPMVKTGLEGANEQSKVLQQEYEKDLKQQKEEQRKLNKFQFDVALQKAKWEHDEALQEKKLQHQERMEQAKLARKMRENLEKEAIENQKEIAKQKYNLEHEMFKANLKKVNSGPSTWRGMLGIQDTDYHTKKKAHDAFLNKHLYGIDPSEERLIERVEGVDRPLQGASIGESTLANNWTIDDLEKYNALPKLDRTLHNLKGFGKSAAKGLVDSWDTAASLVNKLTGAGYEPLAEKEKIKEYTTLSQEEKPVTQLGNALYKGAEVVGGLPIELPLTGGAGSLLAKGAAKVLPVGKIASGIGKIGQGIAKGSKFTKGQRGAIVGGAMGGGTGASLVDQNLEEDTSPLWRGVANIGGGVLGGGVGALTGRAPGRVRRGDKIADITPVLEINPETVQAYNNLGMKPGILDVTDSSTINPYRQRLQNSFGSTRFMKRKEAAESKAIADALSGIGEAKHSKREIGRIAKKAADNVIKESKAKFSKAYDARDKAIYEAAANHKFSPVTGKRSNQTKFSMPHIEELIDRQSAAGAVDNPILSAANEVKKLHQKSPDGWASLQSAIDHKKKLWQLSQSRPELKHVHGALKRDIEESMKLSGMSKEQINKFKKNDRDYAKYKRDTEEPLKKIYNNPSMDSIEESVFQELKTDIGKEGRKLNQLHRGLSDPEIKQLNSGIMHYMGRGNNGKLDISKFATAFTKLEETAQNRLLRGFTDEEAKKLKSALRIVEHWKKSNKGMNFSNTGAYMEISQQAREAAEAVMNAEISAPLMRKLINVGSSYFTARGLKSNRILKTQMSNPKVTSRSVWQPVTLGSLDGSNIDDKMKREKAKRQMASK